MSENYYITNFDIILLAKKYNIPLILISSTKLVDNNKTLLIVNSTDSNYYYFVKVPGIKANITLKYRLYMQDNSFKLPIHKFSISMQTDIKKAQIFNIDKYLENNIKKPKQLPKKPKKLIILKKFEETKISDSPTNEDKIEE